ncbi:hypothetical protein LTR15_002176 [Elasticomyces elasticus]|nr:hypothetical protein LTR15_002176 [Elasticomyces elasticus]
MADLLGQLAIRAKESAAAPDPDSPKVPRWYADLPVSISHEARMYYWMFEQANAAYKRDDYEECRERSLELLVYAYLPKYARIMTLHLLSAVVPVKRSYAYLQEALTLCEDIEERREKKVEAVQRLRTKTIKLIKDFRAEEAEFGDGYDAARAAEELGEEDTAVKGAGEAMDVDTENAAAVVESAAQKKEREDIAEAQRIYDAGGALPASRLKGVVMRPLAREQYWETAEEMEDWQRDQDEEEREAVELGMKQAMEDSRQRAIAAAGQGEDSESKMVEETDPEQKPSPQNRPPSPAGSDEMDEEL